MGVKSSDVEQILRSEGIGVEIASDVVYDGLQGKQGRMRTLSTIGSPASTAQVWVGRRQVASLSFAMSDP